MRCPSEQTQIFKKISATKIMAHFSCRSFFPTVIMLLKRLELVTSEVAEGN